MQVPFSDTVRMDKNIHIGDAVCFINLFEAAEELCAVVLLESVGTKEFQDPLIPPWDPVEGSFERILDGDLGVLRFSLLMDLHTGAFGLEPIRQDPARSISPKTKSVLLLHGYEGEVPADLPGVRLEFIQAVANCPAVKRGLHIIFWLRADDHIPAQSEGGNCHDGYGREVICLRHHVLLQQCIQGAGEDLAQLQQVVHIRESLSGLLFGDSLPGYTHPVSQFFLRHIAVKLTQILQITSELHVIAAFRFVGTIIPFPYISV